MILRTFMLSSLFFGLLARGQEAQVIQVGAEGVGHVMTDKSQDETKCKIPNDIGATVRCFVGVWAGTSTNEIPGSANLTQIWYQARPENQTMPYWMSASDKRKACGMEVPCAYQSATWFLINDLHRELGSSLKEVDLNPNGPIRTVDDLIQAI